MTNYCWLLIPRYRYGARPSDNPFACVTHDLATAISLAPEGFADDPDLLDIRVIQSNFNGEVWSDEFVDVDEFNAE